MKQGRPSWDETFMVTARVWADRATCDRAYVGACIVKNKKLLTTGYNGSPSGHPHCDEVGHKMVDGHCLRTRHAEMNAIMQAVERGTDLKGATIYVTHLPCADCAKAIIREGITRVVYEVAYNEDCFNLFDEANVELIHFKEATVNEG